MSGLGAHEETIAKILEEWDAAEKVIKKAEQISEKIIIPSIKELRYAGRRIVEALHGILSGADDKDVHNLIQDALFNCHRARHDAIDAATSKIAIDLNIAAEKIGYEILLSSFSKFPELKTAVLEAREQIVQSRKDRENRDTIYSTIASVDFDVLTKLYREFQECEEIMIELAKKGRRDWLVSRALTVLGLLLALLGIALTLL